MKVTNLERIKTSEKDSLKMVRNGMPVGIRVSSVERINFDIKLEIEKLIELKENRQYSILINKLPMHFNLSSNRLKKNLIKCFIVSFVSC